MTRLEALARLANSLGQIMVDIVAAKSEINILNVELPKVRMDEYSDNVLSVAYDLLMRTHEAVYREIKTLAAKEYMEKLTTEKK